MHIFDSFPLQGDCEARLNSLDPKFAQSKEKGGYRQFFEMDKQDWTSDFFLGSMPLVSFLDEFTVEARANATLYFALRHCHPMAIPVPMRFSVSVQSPKFLTTQPFSAVCLISSLKPAMDNSDVKSVRCESDVGECCVRLWPCARNEICLCFQLQVRAAFSKGTGPFESWKMQAPLRGTR